MPCEQYANDAVTALAVSVTTTDTTISVISEAGFPSATPFRIAINDEIMLVTGGLGSSTWSVTRAEEETDAAAHAVFDDVVNVLSQGSFDALNACRFSIGPRSLRPTPELEGKLYIDTVPGWYIHREDGSSWKTWGPTFQFYETSEENFTWENLDDGTNDAPGITEDYGSIIIEQPALAVAGENVRLMIQSISFEAPTTPPYQVTIAFIPLLYPANQTSCGIVFRESSTGKFIYYRLVYDTASSIAKKDIILSLDKYTDENTFSANYKLLSASPFINSVIWFRIEDDNTNLTWYFSNDGKNFLEFDSRSRTDFLTGGPDQIGIAVNTNNTVGSAGINLLSWKKE